MTIKHRFVFVSPDGRDRHEIKISPGETASFVANQTELYTLESSGQRFPMVRGERFVINSPDNAMDYWGNVPTEIDAQVIEE